MSFAIKNKSDVLKFALSLFDFLNQNGHVEEAGVLVDLVDNCYPNDAYALEAHRKAYRHIREMIHDLTPEYQLALEEALEVLSDGKRN